jgi:hypothetical protein
VDSETEAMISDPPVDHEHCRCGSRVTRDCIDLTAAWVTPQPICLACRYHADRCQCRDRCCESCGWGPS